MTHRSNDMSERLLPTSTGSLSDHGWLRVDDREMPGRQPDPKEGPIMSENPTQDTQDNAVVSTENGTQEQPTTDVQPEVNTEAAQVAVEQAQTGDVVETTEGGEQPPAEEEQTDAPTIEELLLKDHKERVLGKDRISKSQMTSYREFLTHDPKTNEELDNPLQHPLITDVIGDYDAAMWGRIAKQGKSALGDKAKDVDDAYIEMWEDWKSNQMNMPPKSHMWLKGVVAAALLIAESIGEMQQEQWTTPVPQPGEEGEAVASAEAKDEALAEGATPDSPEQEQPVTPEATDNANASEATEGDSPISEPDETPHEDQGDE